MKVLLIGGAVTAVIVLAVLAVAHDAGRSQLCGTAGG